MTLEEKLGDQRRWPQLAHQLWAKGIKREFNAAAWRNQPFWHWFTEADAERRAARRNAGGTWVDWALVGGAVLLSGIALLTLASNYPARYSPAPQLDAAQSKPAQKVAPSLPARLIRAGA